MRILCTCLMLMTLGISSAASAAPDGDEIWRTLLSRPDSFLTEETSLDILELHSLAVVLGDDALMEKAISRPYWKGRLKYWMQARWQARKDSMEAASASMEHAAFNWRRFDEDPEEIPQVLEIFDRDRLRFALMAGQLGVAGSSIHQALGSHSDDPVWMALRGCLHFLRDDHLAAEEMMEKAWQLADRWQRRDPAFGWRALVNLQGGQSDEAATAWAEYVDNLRWSSQHRKALEIWDAHPELEDIVRLHGSRVVVIRWLSRINRRDQALDIALAGWKSDVDPKAQRDCYLAAAEQMYRLRRHEDLLKHLAADRPTGLDDEGRASLAAYPHGIARRKGAGEEVAQGFDRVVQNYPGTSRGLEALWESAWMWELSGKWEQAQERFERYARSSPSGPFAADSALRAIYLFHANGRSDDALRLEEDLESVLGDGMNLAAALWIEARIHAQEQRPQQERAAMEKLRELEPASPFLQALPIPYFASEASLLEDELSAMRKLHDRQEVAFRRVGDFLGLKDPLNHLPSDLAIARRMLELGLMAEADEWMARYSYGLLRDPVAQLQTMALAWKMGRPERQARAGYQLNLLLRGENEELAPALFLIAYPTPYARAILAEGRQRGISPFLLWALIRRESFYDSQVVSIADAHGLMQLLPRTAEDVAREGEEELESIRDLYRPDLNIRWGSRYLGGVLERAGGDIYRALASYNAGESNGRRWSERCPTPRIPQEMILQISYSETRRYVYEILRVMNMYQMKYQLLME